MSGYAVTLELSPEVYQQAERVAQATQRPLEDIVAEWVRPPVEDSLADLDHLSDVELLQVAGETVPSDHTRRLQALFEIQRGRGLTEPEQQEALALVEYEDRITLRKARALFLLKQRGKLPDGLRV